MVWQRRLVKCLTDYFHFIARFNDHFIDATTCCMLNYCLNHIPLRSSFMHAEHITQACEPDRGLIIQGKAYHGVMVSQCLVHEAPIKSHKIHP